LISFNCKNIKTCGPAIHKLLQFNDIIFIQEHWLFQTQLHLLGEINEHINYIGKGVDKNDPIMPIKDGPFNSRDVRIFFLNETKNHNPPPAS
jgi:hypothetical protein